jgi:hypothetical protein
VKQRNGLREVENVDAGTFAEDETLHLGVPAVNLVAEVNACFEQLAHRKVGKCHVSPNPVGRRGQNELTPAPEWVRVSE